MSRRLLWLLVLGAALSLIALIASNDPDPIINLLRRDVQSLVIKIAAVVFIGGLVLAMFRERLSRALEAMLFWAVVGLVLVVAYTYRHELRQTGDRVLAELIPGRAATRGRNVEIARGMTGHFPVSTHVNGARIAMVLDTGASSIVLTYEAARAAGLPLEILNYSIDVETANGHARAAPVTLERVTIGGLTETAVPALVARPGQLKSNLLGMTFLNRLESWEVRGDKLVLRGYP